MEGGRERARRRKTEERRASRADCTRSADASSAAWLVTLFPSFAIPRRPPALLPPPSSLLSRSSDGESSRSLGETNSCSRFDMSLALPARFGPSFAHSAIYPRLLLSVVLFPFLSSSSFFTSSALCLYFLPLRRPGSE